MRVIRDILHMMPNGLSLHFHLECLNWYVRVIDLNGKIIANNPMYMESVDYITQVQTIKNSNIIAVVFEQTVIVSNWQKRLYNEVKFWKVQPDGTMEEMDELSRGSYKTMVQFCDKGFAGYNDEKQSISVLEYITGGTFSVPIGGVCQAISCSSHNIYCKVGGEVLVVNIKDRTISDRISLPDMDGDIGFVVSGKKLFYSSGRKLSCYNIDKKEAFNLNTPHPLTTVSAIWKLNGFVMVATSQNDSHAENVNIFDKNGSYIVYRRLGKGVSRMGFGIATDINGKDYFTFLRRKSNHSTEFVVKVNDLGLTNRIFKEIPFENWLTDDIAHHMRHCVC